MSNISLNRELKIMFKLESWTKETTTFFDLHHLTYI